MRSLIAIAALLASVCASASDGAWLIYDLKYKEYFLLRIEMITSMTGTATIAGSNQYVGKRVAKMKSEPPNKEGLVTNFTLPYKVNILSGRLTINTTEMKPFMIASYNSAGDEISGDFFNKDGSTAGSFVGALKGASYLRMDLYQICAADRWREETIKCVNRGQNQTCGHIFYRGKNTFLDRENCLEELPKAEQAF